MKASDETREGFQPKDTLRSEAQGLVAPSDSPTESVDPPGHSQPADRGLRHLSSKKKKSKRRKLLYWLLIDMAVAAIVIGLLLHKPAGYNPVVPPETNADGQRVHPYLTHDLMPQLYNGAQSQRPFDMEVLDDALNEAIALARWPHESDGVTFSAPQVLFQPGRIALMGTANFEGAELVITIELGPRLSEAGLLSIAVETVKIGAMNITPLAKMIAKQKYQEYLETVPVDTENIGAQLAAALLNEESFEPVFKVEDKWVRLKQLSIESGRLAAHLVPAR
ncbi:MAG: hypothetical protein JSW27_20915 [Phycisphaerales bacterium]|nr:MAG: hypothetical protein JSW27_20915 [Phycisphaerales bacterium]